MRIIDRVDELIKEKSYTAKQVAQAIGVSPGNLTDWRKDKSKPSADALAKLADFFDVSVDYLLGRTVLRNPPITVAAHTDNPEGIPPEAQEEIFQYVEFIKQKYGIGKKDKKK